MKVALTGITGMRNRGVEAIIVPTIQQLHQRNPNLEIDVLTRTPDYDQLRLKSDRVNIGLEEDYLKVPSRKKRWLAKILPGYKLPAPLISNASVVIVTGGDLFGSDYGVSSVKRHYRPLELALDAGVPVIFLAQSVGPFKTEAEAELWLSVARRAKLVSVRETFSNDYVTKTLGLPETQVKLTADPAFLLKTPEPQILSNLCEYYGLSADRPVVALGVSNAICRYAGGEYENHLQSWQKAIAMILDEFDADVLIIPHVQEISPFNNDRFIATELLKRFNFNPRIKLADAEHSASEFKGLISSCNMVIGERMHSCFAGLSSGVCTVAVGYSVKAEGVMTDLFGAEFIKNRLLISVQDFMDEKKARETIGNAWNYRTQAAEKLRDEVPKFKLAASSVFDLIVGK
ncbi:MAG: polysaccharide pyruvyl transferase family protein [Aphanocapsa sp. GSE-SYN-MK-11-07L]|nr:polysaccharide pyruvyl transferase family protein [Aphanocapsa sp. GSE-SYN-MK-11-07L]